ncbi:hypothetical protein DFJ73DRAFT_837733 [Zopfochytrium polystomum]|nr:hypothetical protein DFJ73DRAFT_837733 [Zopfochytrium polystomum]
MQLSFLQPSATLWPAILQQLGCHLLYNYYSLANLPHRGHQSRGPRLAAHYNLFIYLAFAPLTTTLMLLQHSLLGALTQALLTLATITTHIAYLFTFPFEIPFGLLPF